MELQVMNKPNEGSRRYASSAVRFMPQSRLVILMEIKPKALNHFCRFFSEGIDGAGSSVWYERRIRNAEVVGPNPARSIESLFDEKA
jgi:hypothetical protein